MRQLIFDPTKSDPRMVIVCFVSGSGTNYREIVKRDPNHDYLVFTNRPSCSGATIARGFGHEVVELSHIPFLRGLRQKYGPGNIPRNCPERLAYEQEAVRLIENKLTRSPDLICMAGYDLWMTDWLVDRYIPHMVNVHPGDTTKGYAGLHWIPSARAILAGESTVRSTVFVVDRGEDTGPVLVLSKPLDIEWTLAQAEVEGKTGLSEALHQIIRFAAANHITRYEDFVVKAGTDLGEKMAAVGSALQEALKRSGDWLIYPYAVHDLIGKGRVALEDGKIFLDGQPLALQ